jgi:4-amino-4-deoxy-L-arabinose transferase-like glycosyltransferase
MASVPQAAREAARVSAAPRTRATALALLAIVALAVAVRVAFWSFQARGGAVQAGDPEEYYRAALHLLQGGYYDTGKWIRPPLYPLFLALLFRLLGVDVGAAMLAQALVTGVGVLGFAAYAWQRFGRRRTALLAALTAALYLPLASFGSVMFAEGLFVLLMPLALAALDRAVFGQADEGRRTRDEGQASPDQRPTTNDQRPTTDDRGLSTEDVGRTAKDDHTTAPPLYRSTALPLYRWAFAAGVLLGLATLTRAVGLFFIPLAALLVWLLARPRRGAWRGAALLLLGAALAVGPWTLRNALVHQRLIVVDTNGAISMWYGSIGGEAEQRAGEARLFAIPNQADRQAEALRMTLANIRRAPLEFAARARFKIASLLILQTRNYASGSIIGIDTRGRQVALVEAEHPLWVSLLADAEYVALALLAIAGLCAAPDWRRTLPVLVFVALSVLLSAVTIGHPRLRLPIVGALIPYAAFALSLRPRLRAAGRAQTARHLLAGLGCLAFLALIFSTRYITWLRSERLVLQAQTAASQGDPDRERQLLEQAQALDPANALRALDLGDQAAAQGRWGRALADYRRASELEPRNVYSYAMRIQAAQLLGRPDEARAALAAVASYDRDTNDLYRWAWDAFRTPAPLRLTPGDPLALGHYEGFAPATPDLPAGRWTLGDARLRLAGGCGALELRLRGPAGRLVSLSSEPPGAALGVTLDGAEQLVRLPLERVPGCAAGQPVVVRIASPTGLLDLERAPWMVGVAVLDARVVAAQP